MKPLKKILLTSLDILFIPVTMWTGKHRKEALNKARELDNISKENKTEFQENYQNRLSDMIEDYDDLFGE